MQHVYVYYSPIVCIPLSFLMTLTVTFNLFAKVALYCFPPFIQEQEIHINSIFGGKSFSISSRLSFQHPFGLFSLPFPITAFSNVLRCMVVLRLLLLFSFRSPPSSLQTNFNNFISFFFPMMLNFHIFRLLFLFECACIILFTNSFSN